MAAASSSAAGPSTRAGQFEVGIRVAVYNVGAYQGGGFKNATKRATLLYGIRNNLKYFDSLGVSVALANEIGNPKQP